jgi:hypothetical protein
MINELKITQIFCSMDDFCQKFLPVWHKHLLASGRSRIKSARLTPS